MRRAKAGETITTLDGKKRDARPPTCWSSPTPNAREDIGGVMGGADSEVTQRDDADRVRSGVVQAGVGARDQQEARAQDRSVDRASSAAPIDRAAARDGARAASCSSRSAPAQSPATRHRRLPRRRISRRRMRLDRARIAGLLGMDVPDDAVDADPDVAGFRASTPQRRRRAGTSSAPRWRVDMHRQVDLIEEVGRHHGFEHLPTTFPGVEQAPPPSDPRIARDRRVRTALLGMGFSEAITFAFIEATAAEPFLERHARRSRSPTRCRRLFAVMRPSLLPGLIDAVSHNRRHGRRDVRLFEIGTRFSPRRRNARRRRSAWTGLATADHWSGARRDVDFSDVKGVVEQLAARRSGRRRRSPKPTRPYLVAGRAAALVVNGTDDRRRSASSRRRSPTRAICPPADEIYVGEIDLDALDRRGAGRHAARDARCRATRRSCATSRFSSTIPCLPRRFVAPFGRPRPTR